jgi:glucoamylase
VSRGKILRIILAKQATVVWSTDGGTSSNLLNTIHESKLDLWFADFLTADWPDSSTLTFTLFWKGDQLWEGRDWQVKILDT